MKPEPVPRAWNANHPFVAEFPSGEPVRAWRHDEAINAAKGEQPRSQVATEHNYSRPSAFNPEDTV